MAILSTLKTDMYLVFQGSTDGVRGDFTIYYNPLVMWVWIGGTRFCGIGTVIAMLPNRQTPGKKRCSRTGRRRARKLNKRYSSIIRKLVIVAVPGRWVGRRKPVTIARRHWEKG